MKPNRLIRGHGRMQPWFLRNTSDLYETAVRTYYERGAAGVSHNTRNLYNRSLELEDNEGPVRKLKKAEPEPSYADEYPRTHRLQAKQAAIIASGQLLPTVRQTSRKRSMSSVGGAEMARQTCGGGPYSLLGQTDLGDSSSTSSSSASSEPSQHRLVTLPRCLRRSRAYAKRERKRAGRRDSRVNSSQLNLGFFSARSLSVPPPTGLGIGATPSNQMPPCRNHHMKAIEKTTLANAAMLPMEEGDSLMAVDEALKRQISVKEQTVKGTSSQLGHHLMTGGSGNGRGSGNRLDVIRQPENVRFRFHTLGDRVKPFEYIHFADGPVSNYAFDRRVLDGGYQRRLHKGSSSSSSSFTTIGGQEDLQKQPHMHLRPLNCRNILYANHLQRSRSLESPLPPEVPNVEHLEPIRSTRGSSVDISSRTSLLSKRHTSGQSSASSATSVAQREERGLTKPNTITNPEETPAIKWRNNRKEITGSKPLRKDSSRHRVTWKRSVCTAGALEMNNVTNSRPYTHTESRRSIVAPKQNLNYGAHNDNRELSRDADWQGSSATKSQLNRSSVVASSKGASADPSDAPSGAFAEESSPYPAPKEPTRVTCAPVRRVPLQQRSLEMDSPEKDSPLCFDMVKSKAKPTMKTTLEKLRVPRVTKVTTNRMSRSSHLAFFKAAQEDTLSANKNQNEQPEKPQTLEKAEQSEKNLDKQKWMHGSRAITVPSSRPEKASAKLKPSNQLLVASASQVSAYKRVLRNQQQMLKVEALHQQAQCQQKHSPRPNPSRSSHPSQQLPAEKLRPIHQPKLQSRQGPILTVSRASVRGVLKGTAEGKPPMAGSGKRSPEKAAAPPVTSLLTAMPSTAYRQKPKAALTAATTTTTTTTTGAKGAVSGASTATKVAAAKARPKAEGGGRGGGRQGAVRAVPPSALTLAVQQQYSRNGSGNGSSNGSHSDRAKGNSLLGSRRETANGAASSLLQRRDESESASPLMSAHGPQQRQHQRQQQQQQQHQQQQQQHQRQQQPMRRQAQSQNPCDDPATESRLYRKN